MRSEEHGGAKTRTHLTLGRGTGGAGGRTPGDCSRVALLIYSGLKAGVFAIRKEDGNVGFFV